MDTRYCPTCGAVAEVGARFCQTCGAALDGSTPPQDPSAAANRPAYAPPPPPAPATYVGDPYADKQAQNDQPNYQYPPSPPQQPPYQQIPPQQSGQSPYQPPQQMPYQIPRPRKNRKNTTLTLGIVGLVFSVLLPIVTYCCSIPGLVMAGQNPYTGERDTVGKVLNIVAICVAALNSLAAVISNLVR